MAASVGKKGLRCRCHCLWIVLPPSLPQPREVCSRGVPEVLIPGSIVEQDWGFLWKLGLVYKHVWVKWTIVSSRVSIGSMPSLSAILQLHVQKSDAKQWSLYWDVIGKGNRPARFHRRWFIATRFFMAKAAHMSIHVVFEIRTCWISFLDIRDS